MKLLLYGGPDNYLLAHILAWTATCWILGFHIYVIFGRQILD